MFVNTGVLVAPARAGYGSSLGQTIADKSRHAQEVVSKITNRDEAVGLLAFIEFLLNTSFKLEFVLRHYRQALTEISKAPERFGRAEIEGLQEVMNQLRAIQEGISKFMVDDVEVDATDLFTTIVTAGMAVRIIKTDFRFIHVELLKQIPAKFLVRIVTERWTGPAPDMKSEQRYEAVEWSVPPGKAERDVVILTEGARTSLLEDARMIEGLAPEMEKALKQVGIALEGAQLGVGPVLTAVGHGLRWLITAAGRLLIGRTGLQLLAKRGLLGFLRARGLFTIGGVARVVTWGVIIKLGVDIMTSDVIPKLADLIGGAVQKLFEAANAAAAAVKSGVPTIVTIAGVAIGVLLVGGAIAYVVSP